MNEEWGPWIEHDGGPHLKHARTGDFVETLLTGGRLYGPFVTDGGVVGQWWGVIRYRVRQPRGLSLLRRIAEYPERERIDA